MNQQNDSEHENTRILEHFANQIKTDELIITRGKTYKDKADRATVENVLDPRTMRFLRKLINRGVISEFNGCVSTGKEANVYHALEGNGDEQQVRKAKKEYAVKIFKTSILVFKDRERYVDGEFRFRNARSCHNPRKMIKIWAEKEFRNLKRIYQSGLICCPEPVVVKSNILIMEFLNRGDGFASPRLKDYEYESRDEIYDKYYIILSYIRLLYQECRLVHADLSEYNMIVHMQLLYMIDVSQSVQPEHPMSLDFLRMDIKNVNRYFEKLGLEISPERAIFQFVISEKLDKFEGSYQSYNDLKDYAAKYLVKKLSDEDEAEDEVFRSLHLVRNLSGLEERDFDRFTDGKFDLLKSLIAQDNQKVASSFTASEQYGLTDSSEDSEEGEITDFSSDDRELSGEFDEKPPKQLRGKKHEDKDDKKQRKQESKESKRERRKTKIKKHIKKKLENKTKPKK